MNFTIWGNDYNENNLLIRTNEIEKQIYIGDNCCIIEGLPTSINLVDLEKRLDEYRNEEEDFDPCDSDDLISFLKSIGYFDVNISVAPLYMSLDYEGFNDIVLYDFSNCVFNFPKGGIEVKTYQWSTGSSLKDVELEDGMIETELIVSDDYVNLDEFDGRNFSSGGQFEHERIYKILKKNDENVEDEFLLEHWSQWQGTHPSGKILTLHEVENHLKELNRDIPKYMYELGELSGK